MDVSFHKTLPQQWVNQELFLDDYPGKWQYIYPCPDPLFSLKMATIDLK